MFYSNSQETIDEYVREAKEMGCPCPLDVLEQWEGQCPSREQMLIDDRMYFLTYREQAIIGNQTPEDCDRIEPYWKSVGDGRYILVFMLVYFDGSRRCPGGTWM